MHLLLGSAQQGMSATVLFHLSSPIAPPERHAASDPEGIHSSFVVGTDSLNLCAEEAS